ncbi:helix-turn-helix transcriptional regulator [Thermogemmatispora onikobensis]|uniref:helix-turn-helix transcriptional regulator n=2 Tax=Thermogemmatispora TaxID=768669 RepID=UPI000853C3D0|nr:helix-turn-helix transcriptional regulator [Thermogemmatispora onikobensis]
MHQSQDSEGAGPLRQALIRARRARLLTLEEVAEAVGVSKATVCRWERAGDVPQPLHLRKLCQLFALSPAELGFRDEELGLSLPLPAPAPPTSEPLQVEPGPLPSPPAEADALAAARLQCLPLRLLGLVWRWPASDSHYQQLQILLCTELEKDAMNQNELTRRETLRLLALAPIELLGLSQAGPAMKGPALTEDILKQCAAGLAACWQLRRQGELALAEQAVAAYLPTLQALARTAPPKQSQAAAELAAQGFLLRSRLAWHLSTPAQGVAYAQQAEAFSSIAGNLALQVTALGRQATSHYYGHRYKQALEASQRARYLLEERDRRDRQKEASVAQPASDPVAPIFYTRCYGELAIDLAATTAQKDEALRFLKQAYEAFFAQTEPVPTWVDFILSDLLLDDAYMHRELGLSQEALAACEQIEQHYQQGTVTPLGRAEALLLAVLIEASRDDQPRRLDWCLEKWQAGLAGARQLQSQQRLAEARQAYIALCAAFPGEQRLRELRELLTLT